MYRIKEKNVIINDFKNKNFLLYISTSKVYVKKIILCTEI